MFKNCKSCTELAEAPIECTGNHILIVYLYKLYKMILPVERYLHYTGIRSNLYKPWKVKYNTLISCTN